jgi:hypothetical protein
VKVENSKTAVLKLSQQADDLSQSPALIISAVKQGAATIRKVTTSLDQQLLSFSILLTI